MTDPSRCPECDFALMVASARHVSLTVLGKPLRPVDVVYCDRCGWNRWRTADDLTALDLPHRW